MSVKVFANYASVPTATEAGILGIKVVASAASDVTRPIDIAMVLDTSGSMEGERILAVKNTLCCLIDKLALGDKITVVGFSGKAKVIADNVTLTDSASRELLKASVRLLDADGGTNMEAGVTLLGSLYAGRTMPDSLVLLTDGFVNEGLASVTGIHSLLKSYMPSVPVYALGYGDDHNSDFMRGLSRRTAGTYSFIDGETALPASIGELLGGLQGEVTKSASVLFPSSWTCLELNYTTGDAGYEMGSLIADKPTWAVFSVPFATANAAASISFKLSGVVTSLPITLTDELDRVDVVEQQLRCITALALESAGALLKNHRVSDAKDVIELTITKIADSEAAGRPLAIRMKAHLEEMNAEIGQIMLTPPRFQRGGIDFTNLALRTSSTATRYSQQRGATSNGATDDNMFSSPGLIERQSQMVSDYWSQSPGDPTDMT
jgi:hypothetical protein